MLDFRDWSTIEIQQVVLLIEKCGLLSHIPQETKITYQEQLLVRRVNWVIDILTAFPGVAWHFDSERIYDYANDYQELIDQAAYFSRGTFNAGDISYRYARRRNKIKIVAYIQGHRFSGSITATSDFIDFNYTNIINRCLEKAAIGGRIYTFRPNDCQDVIQMFLSGYQYECLRDYGVITDDFVPVQRFYSKYLYISNKAV